MAVELDQRLQPSHQELLVGRGVSERAQRGKPARLAGTHHQIAAADRADQELAAPVLIEEKDDAVVAEALVEHRQKGQKRAFARPDAPENHRHPDVVDMRDEIVGGAGGRPEPDHRRAPAAVARAMGKRAEICQMRKVARADRAGPGAPFEIARQLREIRRFHAEAFLRHDGAGIGELAARDPRPALELGEALGIDREREVMAAHHKLARGQLVLGGAKACDLRGRLVAGGDHLAGFERQFAERIGPRQKAPGLRQHQRHRQRQQRIEEPGMRRRHVFAQPEDGAITRAARRTNLVRLSPEDSAVGIDAVSERPRHQRHRQ